MSTEEDAFGGGSGANDYGSFEGSISGNVSATAAGSNVDALGGGFSAGGVGVAVATSAVLLIADYVRR